LIKSPACDGKTRRGRRVRVADGVYIMAGPIDEQMHGQLRGDLALACELLSVQVCNNKVGGLQHALVHASGSGQNTVAGQSDGQIPLASRDESLLIHPAPDDAHVSAMLFLRLIVAGKNALVGHSAAALWRGSPRCGGEAYTVEACNASTLSTSGRELCVALSKRLGVNATQLQCVGDPVDRQHISGDPVVDAVRFGVANDLVKSVLHDIE